MPDDSDTAVTVWQEVGILILFVAEATLLAGSIVFIASWFT